MSFDFDLSMIILNPNNIYNYILLEICEHGSWKIKYEWNMVQHEALA